MIDGDFTPPTSPGFIQPTKLLDGATALSSGMIRVYPTTITDAQVAQARLHRYVVLLFITITCLNFILTQNIKYDFFIFIHCIAIVGLYKYYYYNNNKKTHSIIFS